MKLFYTDNFTFSLPKGHSFPIDKYALLRERIMETAIVGPEEILEPQAATEEDILRVHSDDYVNRFFQGRLTPAEIRRIGFPWSSALVERTKRSCGATIQSCRAALEEGIAANLAGGTHHAFQDRGEGYCIFNDVAIAAHRMQAEKLIQRVTVIDCDVHQGNGTAAIFREDSSVFTFSIHGEKNFPFRKENSDLDIPLKNGTGDADYLETLEKSLTTVLDAAHADLAIYIAGADPFLDDRFGRLALSKKALAARDRLVFDRCAERSMPVAVTMGGGYAREVNDTVDIHFQTVKAAVEVSRSFYHS
jgi:acetoin utilization deacetylase AcuC-like enzyme